MTVDLSVFGFDFECPIANQGVYNSCGDVDDWLLNRFVCVDRLFIFLHLVSPLIHKRYSAKQSTFERNICRLKYENKWTNNENNKERNVSLNGSLERVNIWQQSRFSWRRFALQSVYWDVFALNFHKWFINSKMVKCLFWFLIHYTEYTHNLLNITQKYTLFQKQKFIL